MNDRFNGLSSTAASRVENLKEERVSYEFIGNEEAYPFSAQIILLLNLKEGVQQSVRPFEAHDMERVLDFDTVGDAPPDGPLMICEPSDDEEIGVTFPVRQILLRGGYMFAFDKEDIDDKSGPYTVFHAPPLGVIPIDNVQVEFPPGGRRVFREHAHTEANKKGYEFVIIHVPPDPEEAPAAQAAGGAAAGAPGAPMLPVPGVGPNAEENAAEPPPRRRAFYMVAHSLGEREKWAKSIRVRSQIKRETKMRANYASSVAKPGAQGAQKGKLGGDRPGAKAADDALTGAKKKSEEEGKDGERKDDDKNKTDPKAGPVRSIIGDLKNKSKIDHKIGATVSGLTDPEEDTIINSAINEFASTDFDEQVWMNNFFESHNDFDAPARCDQMEHWQASIKKRLKTIVLEQYEYFVQASGEMTTMGGEISTLRQLVETQLETIKHMKEIDFSGNLVDYVKNTYQVNGINTNKNNKNDPHHKNANGNENEDSSDEEDDRHKFGGKYLNQHANNKRNKHRFGGRDDDDISSMGDMSHRGNTRKKEKAVQEVGPRDEVMIEIPSWLDDVTEEIVACMKECRYTDAIDLWTKAKDEIAELYDKHYQPIQNIYLTKKQLDALGNISKQLEKISNKMSNRIIESLRRKNEALKQASKRERSDPLAVMAPIISPCCLDDDMIPLQLLVRLNKTQAAANAFSTRRSLLLLESVHEHPISGAGSVDLVIYSAQLSQSFFSCLARSVEGFLDLFSTASNANNGKSKDLDDHIEAAAHQDFSKSSNFGKSLKFGEKSMHMTHDDNISVGSSLQSNIGTTSKLIPAGAMASIVLWCDAELAKFATAFGGTRILANLALSPAPRVINNGAGKTARVISNGAGSDIAGSRERQTAIEVAAQCVDQAFSCASQNLDSVGLPLTPRLAEYIRSRLKGCESEVAELLDERWSHITLDWRASVMSNGNGMGQYNDIPSLSMAAN